MKKTSTINEKAAIINAKLALSSQGRHIPPWVLTLCYLASALVLIVGISSHTDLSFYLLTVGFILYLLTSLEQANQDAQLKKAANSNEMTAKE